MQFFRLNDNIQIAIEVSATLGAIGTPVPFENLQVGGGGIVWEPCGASGVRVETDTNRKASGGKIHLLIDQPFVGSLQIPKRKIAEVGLSWGEPAIGPLPATREIFFGAKIDIPQSCKLTPGQNMVIDFGSRNREMVALSGQPAILPVERNYTVQCKTTGSSVKVDLLLEAQPHSRDKRYIKTTNSDVGIAVESSGKLISPKPPGSVSAAPDQRLPIDVDYASQQARFGITTYPVRTASLPSTGEYKGEATIKFEFQ
ncbi:hypothetical protein WL02_12270 [Burkholderia ubonensis]|nr:hypothetical protein WL02_12270 [Burkholderia ubonensis]